MKIGEKRLQIKWLLKLHLKNRNNNKKKKLTKKFRLHPKMIKL